MNNIFLIIFLGFLSIFNGVLLNFANMRNYKSLQLGEYKAGNLLNFLKVSYKTNLRTFILAFLFSFTFCLFLNLSKLLLFKSCVIYILFALFHFGILLKLVHYQYCIYSKSKLVFTKRFKRLFIVNCILCAISTFYLYMFGVFYIKIFSIILLPFSILMSLPLVFVGLFLIYPFEQLVIKYYEKRAKNKLKSYKNLKIIGITGSFGKTTTKNILYELLSNVYNVCKTEKSFNTKMGIAKTILHDLKPYHDILILEMGANVKNDISKLCKFVSPNYAIITGVGTQHLRTFKTLENLINTKFQLVGQIERVGGLCVFNVDNEIAKSFYERATCEKVATSLQDDAFDFVATNIIYTINKTTFTLCYDKSKIKCETNLIGKSALEDILLATALSSKLGVSLCDICGCIKNLKSIEHRCELKKCGNYYIIDDAYNSNSDGAKNALNVLSLTFGKKIVVTPGMVELGNLQYQTNYEFGKQIAKVADVCIVVNKVNKEAIVSGIADKIKYYTCDDFSLAVEILKDEICENCCVLYENDLPDNYI